MSSDRTEKPTQQKLREARKKGQIAKSADLGSASAIAFALIAILMLSSQYYEQAFQLGQIAFNVQTIENTEPSQLAWAIFKSSMLIVAAPIVLAGMGALLIMFLQVKGNLSFEPVIPKLENLDPANGIKKIFSINGLIDLIFNILKTLLLGIVFYIFIRNVLIKSVTLVHAQSEQILFFVMQQVFQMLILGVGVLFVLAFADVFYRRWQFTKDQMMTKDEIKREYKQNEGDPHIKGKRKQIARQIADEDIQANVKKAKFVVVNPTHYAVAVHYDEELGLPPRIVAKGVDEKAALIRRIAEKNNIPVVRNVKLARELYASPDNQQLISNEKLLDAVAEVANWLKVLAQRNA